MKHRRFLAMSLLSALASFFGGCANSGNKIKLPDITADTITYRRNDPFGGTTITAAGLKNDGDKITAERVSLSTTYPAFSISIEIANYERKKEPAPAAK